MWCRRGLAFVLRDSHERQFGGVGMRPVKWSIDVPLATNEEEWFVKVLDFLGVFMTTIGSKNQWARTEGIKELLESISLLNGIGYSQGMAIGDLAKAIKETIDASVSEEGIEDIGFLAGDMVYVFTDGVKKAQEMDRRLMAPISGSLSIGRQDIGTVAITAKGGVENEGFRIGFNSNSAA